MSMKRRSFVPAALAVLALVFAAVSVVPASHAQQALKFVPEDDRDVPEGSQIPNSRLQETEEKVEELKAQMREKSQLQQQEQQQETETSDPNGGQQQ
ncbi:MAG: hypothetical protein QNJ30_18290 [Kiloniellales bacterium]|nr:hypothetical protein [Kiloniellales bacterium]